MPDCIFCKISKGELASDVVYEDDDVLAFRDINAQAPVHMLIIPRAHLSTVNDLTPEHRELLGKLVQVAKELAEQSGIAEGGYRLVMNCNNDGGQSVYHIHLHLLGGRRMTWPPG